MLNLSKVAALCAVFVGMSKAEPSPTSEAPATTSISQPGCPSAISLKNPGFESGQIAPWSLLSNTDSTVKQKIISPGYNNSKYALQVDFVADNVTEYSLSQTTTGRECYGYYYNISYSWNWAKYTGPEGPGTDGTNYCSFQVETGYTAPVQGQVSEHFGSRTPGWHHHSYIARDVYSHCKPLESSYVVNVICVGKNYTTTLPGFTILLDDFHIKNAPGNPNPPPTTGRC